MTTAPALRQHSSTPSMDASLPTTLPPLASAPLASAPLASAPAQDNTPGRKTAAKTVATSQEVLQRGKREIMGIRRKLVASMREAENLRQNREDIRIVILDVLSIMMFYRLCIYMDLDFHASFICFELRQLIRACIVSRSFEKLPLKVFIFRYLFSRLLTFYFVFDELFELPYYIGNIIFPLFLSWYFFEPYLICKKMSYSDRIGYCLERYPYFYLLGLIPTLFLLLGWNFCYEISVMWIINSCAPSPDHIPLSRYKFNTDITDVLEEITSRILAF